MKRLHLIWLFVCSISFSYAQKITPYFISAPDDIIGMLSQNQRRDLVDFYQAGKTASVTNLLNGKSLLEKLSDNFVALKTSSAGRLDIKMLPISDTTFIFATIYTVCGDKCDSRISFYNTRWQLLPTAQFIDSGTLFNTEKKNGPVYTRLSLTAESTELAVEQQTENSTPEIKTDTTGVRTFRLPWINGRYPNR